MSNEHKPNGVWAILSKIAEGFYKFELAFMIIFTLYIAVDVTVGIVIRALGFQTLKFSEELGRVMLITTTMVGSSMAVRDDGHMAMDTIFQFVGKKTGQIIKTVVYMFCGVFWLLMGYYGFQFTMKLFKIKKTMESLPICKGYLWAVISFAMVTMGLRYFVQMLLSVRKIQTKSYDANLMDEVKEAADRNENKNTGGEKTC